MSLNEHPEVVAWPEMYCVFVEGIGPFMENAGNAWQQAHSPVPALGENNKITGYMALYEMGPKIYRPDSRCGSAGENTRWPQV